MKLSRTTSAPVARSTSSAPRVDAPTATKPRAPVDSFEAAAKKSTSAHPDYDLVNHGGKVLSAPQFQPIYVGDYWKSGTGAADRTYNDAFARDLVGGNHEALLKQYGVGTGSFSPSSVAPGKAPKTFTQADVVKLVKQQIASGAVKDGAQTVHMVMLPPGTVLKDGSATSKDGLGGFHGSYVDAKGKSVYFGVICYSQGSNGIDFTGKGRDNVTITESHEFDEAATDPDVSTGKVAWYNEKYGEIGDLAVNSGLVPLSKAYGRDSGGYEVQVEWSNKDGKFLAGT